MDNSTKPLIKQSKLRILVHMRTTSQHQTTQPSPQTKPRMSVSLSRPQLAWLRLHAARAGLSVGEFLRRLVDQARGAGA